MMGNEAEKKQHEERYNPKVFGTERIPMVVKCCVCGLIGEKKTWHPVEKPPEKFISHGYCPICYADVMRTLDLGTHQLCSESDVG